MDIVDPHAFPEILLRLGTAAFAGAVLGTDRDLNDKPAGLRTLALVSLGSALIVITGVVDLKQPTRVDDATARIIQGIFAGIGFLGGGVILRHKSSNAVTGLTTAATIWVAAALGVACGLGLWELAASALGLVLLILVGGIWAEAFIMNWFKKSTPPEARKTAAPDTPPADDDR